MTQLEETGENETLDLKTTVDNLEWCSKNLNLEVHSIRLIKDENLLFNLTDRASSSSIPQLALNNVDAVLRLPSRIEKTPGIIVRLIRRSTRDMWLSKR